MNDMSSNVFNIDRSHQADAVEVLCAGFRDYPVMAFFFGAEGERMESCMRQMFTISVSARIQMGWPVLGCELDGKLVGIAYGTAYDAEEWPPEVEAQYGELFAALSERSQSNMRAYGEHTLERKYPAPHIYLHAIASLPEVRGRGVGRVLLDGFQQLSVEDPTSTGVALNTELERNVGFYEHCGYHLVYRDVINELRTWGMFRADEE